MSAFLELTSPDTGMHHPCSCREARDWKSPSSCPRRETPRLPSGILPIDQFMHILITSPLIRCVGVHHSNFHRVDRSKSWSRVVWFLGFVLTGPQDTHWWYIIENNHDTHSPVAKMVGGSVFKIYPLLSLTEPFLLHGVRSRDLPHRLCIVEKRVCIGFVDRMLILHRVDTLLVLLQLAVHSR